MTNTPPAIGRPSRINRDDIERVGRQIGLANLTVHGVAEALRVTPAALYRHVDGKPGLEQLVGESMLAELRIPDSPEDDTATHLLRFAHVLRTFVLDRPGMSAYLQTLFPRGRAGAAVLEGEITALTGRGYTIGIAAMIANAVAGLAISQTAAEERQLTSPGSPAMRRQRDETTALMSAPGVIAQAHESLPALVYADHFHMIMKACIGGILTAAPVGRPVEDIIADLNTELPPLKD